MNITDTTSEVVTSALSREVDDPDEYLNHWIKKSDITLSIVTGVKVPALCGRQCQVRGHGDGRTEKRGSSTCSACDMLYELLA